MKTSDLVWQDTQHQALLDILEILKDSPEAGSALMEKLDIYIDHHFGLEEKYMRLTGYPDIKKHIGLHRKFADKVCELKQSKHIVKEGFRDDEFRKNIVDFLNNWLINHLMGIDKELEAHIMQSDIR